MSDLSYGLDPRCGGCWRSLSGLDRCRISLIYSQSWEQVVVSDGNPFSGKAPEKVRGRGAGEGGGEGVRAIQAGGVGDGGLSRRKTTLRQRLGILIYDFTSLSSCISSRFYAWDPGFWILSSVAYGTIKGAVRIWSNCVVRVCTLVGPFLIGSWVNKTRCGRDLSSGVKCMYRKSLCRYWRINS